MSKKFQYAQKTVPQLFLNTWATIKICPIFFAEVTQVSCADTNDKKTVKMSSKRDIQPTLDIPGFNYCLFNLNYSCVKIE